MRPRLLAAVATASVALAAVGAAPAAPERDAVVRLGTAIGKIELRMTMPQVRRALGGRSHIAVYRRTDFGARGRYVELGWELPGRTSWEPVVWQVGFRSWSRRGAMRVVRVATTSRSERTRQRVGIGSSMREIVKAYPNATCVGRPDTAPHPGPWVVVRSGRGMTAFGVMLDRPGPAGQNKVVTVMVQRTWYSPGGSRPCSPGWQTS